MRIQNALRTVQIGHAAINGTAQVSGLTECARSRPNHNRINHTNIAEEGEEGEAGHPRSRHQTRQKEAKLRAAPPARSNHQEARPHGANRPFDERDEPKKGGEPKNRDYDWH
jgi:hypothetical protein